MRKFINIVEAALKSEGAAKADPSPATLFKKSKSALNNEALTAIPRPDIEGLDMFNVVFIPSAGTVWVEVIAVEDKHRSEGIGKAVVDYIKSESIKLGAFAVVGESTLSATSFWKKMGFRVGKPNNKNRHPMVFLTNSSKSITEEVEQNTLVNPSEVARVAQRVYDLWTPEDDLHGEWGNGGICHRIAYEIMERVSFDGDAMASSVEEPVPHTFIVVSADDGSYRVDIPYHHYEEYAGGGFNKIEGVIFSPDMVEVTKLSDDPNLAYELSDDEEGY